MQQAMAMMGGGAGGGGAGGMPDMSALAGMLGGTCGRVDVIVDLCVGVGVLVWV